MHEASMKLCNLGSIHLRITGGIAVPPALGLGFSNFPTINDSQRFTMSDNHGSYQTEIYGKGALMGILPGVTTDPRKLEEQARESLGVRAFNYVAGGAGEKATMDSNRLAFRQWKL